MGEAVLAKIPCAGSLTVTGIGLIVLGLIWVWVCLQERFVLSWFVAFAWPALVLIAFGILLIIYG